MFLYRKEAEVTMEANPWYAYLGKTEDLQGKWCEPVKSGTSVTG